MPSCAPGRYTSIGLSHRIMPVWRHKDGVHADAGLQAMSALLSIEGLRTVFRTGNGEVAAVDGVSLSVRPGRTLGIVGESGCGKSMLSLSVMRLVPSPGRIAAGKVMFDGRDLLNLPLSEMRDIRGNRIAMIFQEPMTSLNPVFTVGDQITEAMRAHDRRASGGALRSKAIDALGRVRIPDPARRFDEYPHQMSGGMRQRVMIAMALLLSPDLIVMDEPTSALDVVAQRSLMVQVKELQRRLGFAVIFVTHDMSLVGHFSDRLAVMYAGKIVEIGPTRRVFDEPQHPYTRGLLNSFPSIHGPKTRLTGIPGSPPSLIDPPSGCRFRPRCPSVMPRCAEVEPDLYPVDSDRVRCLLYEPAGMVHA